MATQPKTPTKRTAKPAAIATPQVEAPVTEPVAEVVAPQPVAAEPVVEAAPAAAKPAVKTTDVKVAAAATFEFPKFELPKFEMPKFEVAGLDLTKFELPAFEMPKFDVPSLDAGEMSETLRGFAEKALEQAKANFDKLKLASEEAADALEDTYEATRAGVVEYSNKSIDAVKANSNAALGHAKHMLGVKTFAEAIELQSSFVRQQYEAMSAQAKELQDLATKLAGEAAKPAKDALGKAVDLLKKAD